MADWLFTLEVKQFFSEDDEGTDFNAAAIENAPKVARSVRSLMKRINKASMERYADRIGDLYIELDEVADALDDIPKLHKEVAQLAFNDALTLLYDVGDSGNRVWVK